MKPYQRTIERISFFVAFSLAVILLIDDAPAQEKQDEETYSISLVQTAEANKQLHEVEGVKVLAESYTVEKGDTLWSIYRKKGLTEDKEKLHQLLYALKNLNSSLINLDLIHPGEKIVIPLLVSPIGRKLWAGKELAATTVGLKDLKDIDLHNYTVRQGEHLVRIVQSLYEMPLDQLYNQYLYLVKKLNPSIQDLDLIHPGQMIRLPIYSPQKFRGKVATRPPAKPEPEVEKKVAQIVDRKTLSSQLGHIFTQLGEEWLQRGEHFIPLESGGEISLKAESYPIINLNNGYKVIVDLNNSLPKEMARLIQSSWDYYGVAHLSDVQDLRGALERILPACHYLVYKRGEALDLEGDIPLRITADWIIKPTARSPSEEGKIVAITLLDDNTPKTPQAIRDFLYRVGIKLVDYPGGFEASYDATSKVEILSAGHHPSSLVEMLLNLTGQKYEKQVEIPVFRSGATDFNLIVKADFLLNVNGRDCVINLTRLGPEIISLLKEHKFLVLTLANQEDPSSAVSGILDLLGVQFDSKPHHFMAAKRDKLRNVRLTIPGIVFRDSDGQNIFATRLNIPEDIARFLSQKGYKILSLALS